MKEKGEVMIYDSLDIIHNVVLASVLEPIPNKGGAPLDIMTFKINRNSNIF